MNVIDTQNQKNIPLSHYVGLLIRKARIQNGLTGTELAKQVYLSQQQISRYERGQTGFQLDVLLRMLSALNMNEMEMKAFFSDIIEQTEKLPEGIKAYSEDYFK
ncbi:helix-turn-helix domain-containing protein [Providencia rettgeri]|uniref:Transcriptional regulator, y4mF family n=1 Tax=Providencia rettgeri TaxID=587 RepID=A0A379FUR1_PRORE|nr:helix-turn-helix transcriptional regulator [Providencia rettgeri]MCG9529008.1 helix-turn-helix domain-containing protein [Providencia rettgeri]QXB04798.1 helix-turn-helix domain-containing protein [Providencia rettgeri]SUC32103.1 transcriptional regulator, y4mF family [Providencia rettgeri]